MKKVLLSCVAFFTMLSSFAQTHVDSLPNGYWPTLGYAKDYFKTKVEYGSLVGGGVYWWTQAKTGAKLDTIITKKYKQTPVICPTDTSYFKYYKTRSGDGTLDYTIWQPYGKYEPIGVGFGVTYTSPTDSTYNTLNISNSRTVSFTFTNTNTNDTLDYTVKVLLQDVHGNLVNSVGPDVEGNTYIDEILFNVGPSDGPVDIAVDFTVDNAAGDTAYYANYPLDSCGEGLTPSHDYDFDYTQVQAVMITVVDKAQNSADGYKHPALVAAPFTISNFFVGDPTAQNPVGLADNFLSKPSFKIYPNPVSNVNGVLNFEKEVKNVQVMNGVGQVVYTAPSASSLNVNNYTKGMYVISSTTGNARFVVE